MIDSIYLDDVEVEKEPAEIRMADNGFYKGFIEVLNDDNVVVSFEQNWHPRIVAPYENVRLARKFPMLKVTKEVGMEVDEYSLNAEKSSRAYWSCTILEMIDGNCKIQYNNGIRNSSINVVPAKCLFIANFHPVLNKDDFLVHTFNVAEEHQNYVLDEGVLETFKESLRVALVSFDKNLNQVTVRSPSEKFYKRSIVMSDVFLKGMADRACVSHHKDKIQHKIDICNSKGIMNELTVDKDLAGTAIGKEKYNLRAARALEGIGCIKFQKEENVFLIYGNNDDSIDKAREILEYTKDYVFINKYHLPLLIKKGNNTIKDIVVSTGVLRIFIPDTLPYPGIPEKDGHVPIIIIGKKKCTEDAKNFLVYQLSHLEEIFSLRDKSINISNKFATSVEMAQQSRNISFSQKSQLHNNSTNTTAVTNVHDSTTVITEVTESDTQTDTQAIEQTTKVSSQSDPPNKQSEMMCPTQMNSETTEKSVQATEKTFEVSFQSDPPNKQSQVMCSIQINSETTEKSAQATGQIVEVSSQSDPPNQQSEQTVEVSFQSDQSETMCAMQTNSEVVRFQEAVIESTMIDEPQQERSMELFKEQITKNIKYQAEATLGQWIEKSNYHGPLLIDFDLSYDLKAHVISPDLSKVISAIVEELRVLLKFKDFVCKPYDDIAYAERFMRDLSALLHYLECPYLVLMSGRIENRISLEWQKKLLLKYLISELICLRLVHDDMACRELGYYLSTTMKKITADTINQYINVPCIPSDITIIEILEAVNSDMKELQKDDEGTYEDNAEELFKKYSRLRMENRRVKFWSGINRNETNQPEQDGCTYTVDVEEYAATGRSHWETKKVNSTFANLEEDNVDITELSSEINQSLHDDSNENKIETIACIDQIGKWYYDCMYIDLGEDKTNERERITELSSETNHPLHDDSNENKTETIEYVEQNQEYIANDDAVVKEKGDLNNHGKDKADEHEHITELSSETNQPLHDDSNKNIFETIAIIDQIGKWYYGRMYIDLGEDKTNERERITELSSETNQPLHDDSNENKTETIEHVEENQEYITSDYAVVKEKGDLNNFGEDKADEREYITELSSETNQPLHDDSNKNIIETIALIDQIGKWYYDNMFIDFGEDKINERERITELSSETNQSLHDDSNENKTETIEHVEQNQEYIANDDAVVKEKGDLNNHGKDKADEHEHITELSSETNQPLHDDSNKNIFETIAIIDQIGKWYYGRMYIDLGEDKTNERERITELSSETNQPLHDDSNENKTETIEHVEENQEYITSDYAVVKEKGDLNNFGEDKADEHEHITELSSETNQPLHDDSMGNKTNTIERVKQEQENMMYSDVVVKENVDLDNFEKDNVDERDSKENKPDAIEHIEQHEENAGKKDETVTEESGDLGNIEGGNVDENKCITELPKKTNQTVQTDGNKNDTGAIKRVEQQEAKTVLNDGAVPEKNENADNFKLKNEHTYINQEPTKRIVRIWNLTQMYRELQENLEDDSDVDEDIE